MLQKVLSIGAIEIESMGITYEPDPEDIRSSLDKSLLIKEIEMLEK